MSLGLRRGEALALRWSDLDLDARTISVSRSLQRRRTAEPSTRGRYRTELVEEAPKTEGSVRVLALPASLVVMLKEHRTRQLRERVAAKFWADADLMFATPVGTPIDPQNN